MNSSVRFLIGAVIAIIVFAALMAGLFWISPVLAGALGTPLGLIVGFGVMWLWLDFSTAMGW